MADPGRFTTLPGRLPFGQILRFSITGILATLTHFAVLTTGVEVFGLPPIPTNGLAFCVAVIVTYLGQSLWVFRARGHNTAQMGRFVATALLGLVSNVGLMALVVRGLGLPYQVGFVTALICVPLMTFVANKFWVFSECRDR